MIRKERAQLKSKISIQSVNVKIVLTLKNVTKPSNCGTRAFCI